MNWTQNQRNLIAFVMVDANGAEVPGLAGAFTLEVSKAGGAFAASAGDKAEIGSGWYSYHATIAEADTPGEVAIRVNAAGCVQQNLVYQVGDGASGAIAFTYTATSSVDASPIGGATVVVTTDVAGTHQIATGTTDASGQVVFMLQPGTYYFWTSAVGYSFTNPDTEVV